MLILKKHVGDPCPRRCRKQNCFPSAPCEKAFRVQWYRIANAGFRREATGGEQEGCTASPVTRHSVLLQHAPSPLVTLRFLNVTLYMPDLMHCPSTQKVDLQPTPALRAEGFPSGQTKPAWCAFVEEVGGKWVFLSLPVKLKT